MNTLPDWFRVWLGCLLVWSVKRFKLAELPSAEAFTADNAAEIAATIQAYMDAVDAEGKRGGWRAGRRALDAARKPGEALFTTSEWLLVTLVMGLSGTPKTAAATKALLDGLKQQYLDTGRPDYLFEQVVAFVTQQLKEVDQSDNWFSAGILQKMFEVRQDPTPPIGWRARELAVLTAFKQSPEYVKFLSVDDDGSFSLPRGKSYEEFAAAMLANAYGPYPF